MRSYDLTVIFKTEEELYTQAKALVINTIKDNGGDIAKEDELGERALATSIKGHNRARYVFFSVNILQDKLPALEKVFRLEQAILKYFFVRAVVK